MKRVITVLIILVFVSLPAMGQAKASDPAKIANIRHLLKLTRGEDVQQMMVNQILTALKPMLTAGAGNDAQSRKVFNRFSDLVVEEFKKIDFVGVSVALYDKYFTNEEILGLIHFYETPVGQKATQVLPSLVQESMARGQEQGQQATARALTRVAQEFPELREAFQRLQ
jgi:uncharacterized protein